MPPRPLPPYDRLKPPHRKPLPIMLFGTRFASIFAAFLFTGFLLACPNVRRAPNTARSETAPRMVWSRPPMPSPRRSASKLCRRAGMPWMPPSAVGLALAVTYPSAGNLGGGGFMLIRRANGQAVVIDYRETAPGPCHVGICTLILRAGSFPMRRLSGYRASGVPGTVAGLALAQKKYGRLPWKIVVAPARRLAEQGFVLTNSMASGNANHQSPCPVS